MTELIGDIVLSCSGGAALAPGSIVPTVNISISLATNVTSRLTGTGLSEALLLIDEPGSGLSSVVSGFGPSAPQTACVLAPGTNPLTGAGPGGCVQYSQNATAIGGGTIAVASSSPTITATPTPGANLFLGAVTANQVTFNGIPVLPTGSTGATRVYRITNIRANVSGLQSGLAGITPLNASISISPSTFNSTSVPLTNSFVVAGYIQNGLTATVANATNTTAAGANIGSPVGFNQCQSQTLVGVTTLRFAENFGTAFKTRVAPTGSYNGQAGTSAFQNIPGAIYNSESGFVGSLQTVSGSAATILGLADYGTRLKAVFNNIPSGVRIFVSVTNLAANTSSNTTAAPGGNVNTSAFAVLVNGEANPDGNGTVPTLASTATAASGATLYEVPQAGNSATAVWEVINTNPALNETFNFGVFLTYSANPGANSPAPNAGATVNLSYAPTPPGPFSATAGSQASATLTIPRFVDTSTARPLTIINICQTYLLFPFLTNATGQGFDTGIAIANTSTDPSTIGTGPQNGVCDLFFYGDSAPATLPVTTTNIASGKVYTTLVSTAAPGFTGYGIARCNFQWAHGFAFISDIGARNLAMGYLALVLNNGTLSRGTQAESLGN